MSILIRGMEMPKGCGNCKLFDASHAIGLFAPFGWCRINGKEIFRVSEKADFCPLILVPPHGDLIDRREAIIDANERAYDFWLSDDEVNATIQFLEEQPTIIPAEEGE